jgi:hypothetical protein
MSGPHPDEPWQYQRDPACGEFRSWSGPYCSRCGCLACEHPAAPAHRGERSMTREELVEALIDLGIDPDKFRGYGHITAGPLADALLERFELRPREENG